MYINPFLYYIDVYCSQRKEVLLPIVREHLNQQKVSNDMLSFTRAVCAYLVRLCVQEYTLFHSFFDKTELLIAGEDTNNLTAMLSSICYVLKDVIRPQIIHTNDVVHLCELIQVYISSCLGQL